LFTHDKTDAQLQDFLSQVPKPLLESWCIARPCNDK
jgi:hypothetical protein